MDLNETFIAPLFKHNLISISALNKYGFSYSFGNEKFKLFHDSKLISFGFLSGHDKLYLINTIASFNESLQHSAWDLKKKLTNKKI